MLLRQEVCWTAAQPISESAILVKIKNGNEHLKAFSEPQKVSIVDLKNSICPVLIDLQKIRLRFARRSC